MARPTDKITIVMTRGEAGALLAVFDIGIRVVEALGLIKNTATAERAQRLISAALGVS